MNRYSSAAVIFVILLCCACSRGGDNSKAAAAAGPPAVAVRAVAAAQSDVPLDVSGIGTVEAISSVDVKARVTGPVLRVNFQEGQDVTKGSLLFELDPEPIQRMVAELEANLARDVANEKQARANIAKDEATLKNARAVADRGTQLAKAGIFSREQTEQVVTAADSAKASIDADRAALESAQAAMKADQAKLAQTRLQLSYTKIMAPISGRTGAIAVKAGSLAKENDTTLVTVLQTTPIYVSFSLPESLLAEVRKYNAERPLEVTATTADGVTSTGTLKFIDNTVDSTTGTIRLKASFDNPARKLWPGQFVNVRVQLGIERGRIVVPARTVQSGPRGKYVWVKKDDSSVEMREVQVVRNYTSREGAEQAVIGSGLKENEMVISEGQMRLIPGAHVRLLGS
ncbi:MAG: efflux RND transporter periplasmic adaptor subunit [Bryobacteraceae bacterium]